MIMCGSDVCVCAQCLCLCEYVCAWMSMCLRERYLSVMSACQQCNITIITFGDIMVAI